MEQKFHLTTETKLLEGNETDDVINAEDDELDEFGIAADGSRILKVRLDKWLWAARFFKTRAVARAAVEKGKVFYNGERSKPSREIEIGATLQIRHGRLEKTIIVKGLSTRRRNQEEAFQLFEETKESLTVNKNSFMPSSYTQRTPVRNGNLNSQVKSNYFNTSSYTATHEPVKERRSIRFLRRSFNRSEGRVNNNRAISPTQISASTSKHFNHTNKNFEGEWFEPSQKKHELEPIDS